MSEAMVFKIRRLTYPTLKTALSLLFSVCAAQLAQAQSFTILHEFNGSDGAIVNRLGPASGPVLVGKQGQLYGTAWEGGQYGCGVVYTISPSGEYKVLHDFAGGTDDGSNPMAGVYQDKEGNLFGTAFHGGLYGGGCIYKIDSAGIYTVVYHFPWDDGGPVGTLLPDKKGNLYGTAWGSVFKLDSEEVVTTLHQFVTDEDGLYANSQLVMDKNENLYGATSFGGEFKNGLIYKIDPTGVFSQLHSFNITIDAFEPSGQLAIDKYGNVYGTAMGGNGVVYQIDPSGNFTQVCYVGNDLCYPRSGVVMDKQNNLYGTSMQSIEFGWDSGAVYKVDAFGNLTVLHDFNFEDGAVPFASVALDEKERTLYGTASGGTEGFGVIYKIDLKK